MMSNGENAGHYMMGMIDWKVWRMLDGNLTFGFNESFDPVDFWGKLSSAQARCICLSLSGGLHLWIPLPLADFCKIYTTFSTGS